MPKVSVIIPTHNRAELLKAAVNSVLRQTYKDLDIWIVDDDSSDHTPFVAKTFPGNVHYLRQAHAGLNAARNLAVEHAQGEYIALLDDDDLWHPFKIELQIGIMEKFQDISYAFSNFTIFDSNGVKAEDGLATWNEFPGTWNTEDDSVHSAKALGLTLPPDDKDYTIYCGDLYTQLLYDPYILPSTAMFRKSIVQNETPFPVDNFLCGDWQFFAKLSRTTPCAYMDLCTTLNRSHDDGVRLTRKSPRTMVLDRLNLVTHTWRSDHTFLRNHSSDVNRIEAEQLDKLILYCLLENRRQEALAYKNRRQQLTTIPFGLKQKIIAAAASIPLSPYLLQMLGFMKRTVRSLSS